MNYYTFIYLILLVSCISQEENSLINDDSSKFKNHIDSSNSNLFKNEKPQENYEISLKKNGESLIKPLEKLNSLDSSIVYYKAHFPYSEEFKKYSDTGKYNMYILKYKDLDSLFQNTQGQMGADIYLSVEKISNRIVGIEGRWAFYVDPSDTISSELISYIQNTFFPDLATDIEAKHNWYYQIEAKRHQEHIKFIDFKESSMGNLELPVVSYVVEF